MLGSTRCGQCDHDDAAALDNHTGRCIVRVCAHRLGNRQHERAGHGARCANHELHVVGTDCHTCPGCAESIADDYVAPVADSPLWRHGDGVQRLVARGAAVRRVSVLLFVVAALLPGAVVAQGTYGQRVSSRDGQWLLPVASNMLGSHEHDHKARGSVDAWDVTAAVGSPVFPIAAGTIEYAGCNNAGGYGCWLFINHGNAKAIYAHCGTDTVRGRRGDTVSQWTQICNVGMTGMTSWPHVHLEIHRIGGGRYEIGEFFNEAQMYYCKFCKSSNAPDAPITGIARMATSSAQQQPQNPALPALSILWLVVPFSVLFLAYMLSGYSKWSQHAIYHGMALFTCTVFFVALGGQLMVMPVSGTAKASVSTGASGWETAYKFVMGEENFKCTVDPVLTMGGVTQGTYTAWRMSQGLGPADVCKSLTESQRQAIFIERYWQASGADKMSAEMGLTHVDFAFNAGVGAAKKALAASGGDVRAYNDYRESFYVNASLCRLYCAGWLNRLNRIRKMTE